MDSLDRFGSLLHQTKNLIEFCCEEVESGQYTAVGSKVVPLAIYMIFLLQCGVGNSHTLLHDLLVIHSISDVDIGFKWEVRDSRIEI